MTTKVTDGTGFLYILRPHVLINGERIIRIGATTRSVAEKVRELERRSSVNFDVVYSVAVENPHQLEKQLCQRYASRRMAGGSEGFFHMEPEEVVPEIEHVAAELARSSSEKARNAEFSAYCKNIGATRFKTSVALALNLIWFLASVLIGFGAVKYAPFEIPAGMHSYAIVGSLFVVAVMGRIVLMGCQHLIEIRYFSRRFGPALRAKDEELREKYPSL